MFFKCGNGPFSSIVFCFQVEGFVPRNLSLLSVGDKLLACEQALRVTWAGGDPQLKLLKCVLSLSLLLDSSLK